MEPPGLATLSFAEGSSVEDGSLREFVVQLTKATQGRIYMHFDGPEMQHEGAPTPHLLRALGVLFDALAALAPRKVAVPLVSSAGWDAGAMAALPEVVLLARPSSPSYAQHTSSGADSSKSSSSYQHVVAARKASNTPAVETLHLERSAASHQGTAAHHAPPAADTSPSPSPAAAAAAAAAADTQAAAATPEWIKLPRILPPSAGHDQPPSTSSDSPSAQDGLQVPRLQFRRVAVGGTFDRLHVGHELLLATTALVATEKVYVGITADKLLSSKKWRELVQPYEVRALAAEQYMSTVNPRISVESGALSDPQEPTQAELDPLMEAIVVSEETLPGAIHINKGRAARGFAPLLVVVVPVIGSIDPAHKLSSTQLREADATAAAARH